MNLSLKIIFLFSGDLGSLFYLLDLEFSFEITLAEFTGPGPESRSSKAPQNISPFPLFMQMNVWCHCQVIHKEKLLPAHQLPRKVGAGFDLKSLSIILTVWTWTSPGGQALSMPCELLVVGSFHVGAHMFKCWTTPAQEAVSGHHTMSFIITCLLLCLPAASNLGLQGLGCVQ